MKKIIASSLIAILPILTMAAGVSIDEITTAGGNTTIQGVASYNPASLDDPETEDVDESLPAVDTLNVAQDSAGILSGTNATSWSVSVPARIGTHVVKATVSDVLGSQAVSVERSYTYTAGGGILQPLATYCWILSGDAFANCDRTVYTRIIPMGQEGCPFFMGCKGL